MHSEAIKEVCLQIAIRMNTCANYRKMPFKDYLQNVKDTPFGEKISHVATKYAIPEDEIKRRIYEHYLIWATS